MDRTSSTLITLKASPLAALMLRIVASCSFVSLPEVVFTSKATNLPPMHQMISGKPAGPYMPPCSFQQKQRGTVFR